VVEIGGKRYDRDVVIEKGKVRRRRKGPSKPMKARYGHTPLTPKEDVPWGASILVIGTGADGQLPITDAFREEADRRGVDLITLQTDEACKLLRSADPEVVAAILHVTC
jgi:hypothetical protein